MKLLEIYTDILHYCGLSVDEKGYVSLTMDNDPVFVNGDRLVIPTKYQLKECRDRERIVMHPLAEDIVVGESSIVKKLRYLINVRLNWAIANIGPALLDLVASEGLHGGLTPEQREILYKVKDCDATSAKNLNIIAGNKMKEAGDHAFLNIFLCRGKEHKGKKYARLGVVSFPFYRDMVEGKAKLHRTKDAATFMQLFEFMFPNIAINDEYNFGSDSSKAPFLHAMLMTSLGLTSRINELIETYRTHIESKEEMSVENLMFSLNWYEAIKDIEDLGPEISTVPPQPDGRAKDQAVSQTPQHVQTSHQVATQASQPAKPVQQPAAQGKRKEEMSVSDFFSSSNTPPPPPQQPMMYPGMVPGGMMPQQMQPMMHPGMMPAGMMPAGMAPQGMYPQGMMPGQPMQPMMYPQGMAPAGMMPQQHVPSWAQIPPQQVMVNTPQGMMNLAVATQLNLPYTVIPTTGSSVAPPRPMGATPSWG